jgi:hypothetical protein
MPRDEGQRVQLPPLPLRDRKEGYVSEFYRGVITGALTIIVIVYFGALAWDWIRNAGDDSRMRPW